MDVVSAISARLHDVRGLIEGSRSCSPRNSRSIDRRNNTEGIIGCILADHAGLCLGAKGDASTDSAGIIAAIADQVAKLEPKSPAPIISLQNENRKCLIQRQGSVVGAIYKDVSV
ncbi:hypothetical protein WH47_10569 [Habropoda laboriosa]|uniref:Late endosomal/lysosomal adaptor and MAPK and MTOR activator 5 n=1 Tax=Habropoda laboriosa TaxID=597456 RepID=A0A0L7QMQ1_9HYME|nr:hypothetical protein WH47_10569 [Habropoda laboriosa]